MKSFRRGVTLTSSRLAAKGLMVSGLTLAISAVSNGVLAQSEPATTEEVVVTGIRASLASALETKRNAASLVEVIEAEDIGKLPDQNLAEVLENVTGIQITRTAGVGTGVQIRGTSANRTEINGSSTVGSGSGRSGIDFEDLNAAIIAGVEVTKSPEAKTVEGSVGGTVNLKTIRPLDLEDMMISARIQGEESSLSTESTKPRFSAAFGNNWDTADNGTFGFVISGSYIEQEAVSFRPRVDRDGALVENVNADVIRDGSLQDPADRPAAQEFDFLGIQFLTQEKENDDYETTNLSTTFEWAPNDNLKLFFDAIIVDQERSRDQVRLQASGIGNLKDHSVPDSFETINFGSLGGVELGSIQAALTGGVDVQPAVDDDDPNLRSASETNSRVTDTELFRFGGEWEGEDWNAKVVFATTSSDTVSPNVATTINFLNPNAPDAGNDNDNAVPFVYDLSGKKLSFGIDFDSAFAPSAADLLVPANWALEQVQVDRDTQDNAEDSFTADFTYHVEEWGLTSVDVGYRFNQAESTFEDFNDRIGGFSNLTDAPLASSFSELLIPGDSNFGSADGRALAIRNYLIVDPDLSFNNPDLVISTIEDAIIANGDPTPDLLNLQSSENAFFDIEETTNAFYVQANFESGIFRGNIGLRYLETEIKSTGFGPEDVNGDRSLETTKGDYSFVLPRFNLVAQPIDDVLIRLGLGTDIRRPNFSDLSTGFTFSQNENNAVSLGNPGLSPEEVVSFDISVDWYFAPAAVASIGYFHKERTNIFGDQLDSALLIGDMREPGPDCTTGIYNPEVIPNVLGDPDTTGLCVDVTKPGNDPATTTQQGVEMAFQYDLAEFEDRLGWASGFGIITNYTIQDFSGGSVVDQSASRGTDILNASAFGLYNDADFVRIEQERGLLDFSETAYNFTLFYEKYGVSARMRYTWREAFRTEDLAGGASLNSTLGFPVVTDDRGQLNGSINYDITENFNIGIEGTNLTEEGVEQYCVNNGALLCFAGLPDRRITFGLSYSY